MSNTDLERDFQLTVEDRAMAPVFQCSSTKPADVSNLFRLAFSELAGQVLFLFLGFDPASKFTARTDSGCNQLESVVNVFAVEAVG